MTSQALGNLAKIGSLKQEPPSRAEFDGLRRSGEARLKDAHDIRLAPESRFDLGYNAAHALSLAALRWHGYRPASRFIVFQALEHTLDLPAEAWRVLDRCHAVRNAAEYEGRIEVDEKLLKEMLGVTDEVRKRLAALSPLPARRR